MYIIQLHIDLYSWRFNSWHIKETNMNILKNCNILLRRIVYLPI